MSKKQADYSAFLRDLAEGMIETANEPFTRIAERDDCIECAKKLKETADAYDAMLAACEKMSALFGGDRDMEQMDSADFKDNACAIISACAASDAAIAIAKPVTGKAASASQRQGD